MLALAAGARRTATAPNRYTAAAGGDVGGLVLQPSGRPRLARRGRLAPRRRARRRPHLRRSMVRRREGDQPLCGRADARRSAGVRSRREPQRAGESVANLAFVEAFNATVGQTYEIGVWTQPQVDRERARRAAERSELRGHVGRDRGWPGRARRPDTEHVLLARPARERHWCGDDLDGGAARTRGHPRRPTAQLDSLPDGSELALEPLPIVSVSVRNAVAAQAQGLWVITLVAAFAALAAMGQVLSRHARVSELPATVGGDRRQPDAASRRGARSSRRPGRGRPTGAALVATLASGWFPGGFVRRVEPAPGFRADVVVLGAGLAVLVVALLAWVAVASWLAQRTRAEERPSKVVELVASRTATPAAPRPGCGSPSSGATGRAARWRARSSDSSSPSLAWSPPPGSP